MLPGDDGRNGAGRLIGGLTDVVASPFSPPMIRARTRAWLSRTGTFTPRRSTRREHRLFGLSGSSTSGLLKGLPLHERVALLAGGVTRRFRPGEVIFRQGDPSGGIYFLRTGRVQLSSRLPDGRDLVVGTAEAGDVIGELSALDGGPRLVTATALQTTTADYLPPETFESALAAAPGAALRLLRLLAGQLRQSQRSLGELSSAAVTDPALPGEMEPSDEALAQPHQSAAT